MSGKKLDHTAEVDLEFVIVIAHFFVLSVSDLLYLTISYFASAYNRNNDFLFMSLKHISFIRIVK